MQRVFSRRRKQQCRLWKSCCRRDNHSLDTDPGQGDQMQLCRPGGYKEMSIWLTKCALVYEPKCWGGGSYGVSAGLSQWVQLYTGAQINFGDLTPYLTYDVDPVQILGCRGGEGAMCDLYFSGSLEGRSVHVLSAQEGEPPSPHSWTDKLSCLWENSSSYTQHYLFCLC